MLALALMFAPTPAPAAAPPWAETSFTYIAANQKLADVLLRFARTFGIEAQLSTSVQESAVLVNGRITTATPGEFLNQLGASYGLAWYYQNGVLYVSRSSERKTQAVAPPGFSPAGLKKALTDLGVVEAKFGWGEVPDRGLVLVSGPPSYVDMVARTVTDLPPAPPDQQLHVFKLRHASAEDRTLTYRDKQITTTGVATILRALLSGNDPRASTLLSDLAAPLRAQYDAGTRPPLPNLGPVQPPLAQAVIGPGSRPDIVGGAYAPPPVAANAGARGVIQTDTRLNAIIVKDKPENIVIYKQLIELLDVPSELIEIEAMIVDVNSSRFSELGVDWSIRRGAVRAGFSGAGALAALATGGTSTVLADAAGSLLARINALETEGGAKIMLRPSILTIDNLGALIDLSETFYIQTNTERAATVTPVSVGVTLKVTPRIIADKVGGKAVQLVVDIEDGSIQENLVGQLPTVRRTTIGTQAVIGERESLLVGGFNSNRSSEGRNGVPGLSDIPLFGAMFKKNTTLDARVERLFLITPRIVASPVQ